MNNKGQVLVVFVILLPLVLLFITFIIDLGRLYTEKRNIENNIESSINYGLNNESKENLEEIITSMLNDNIEDVDSLDVKNLSDRITVSLKKTYPSLFKITKIKDSYTIESTYTGYKQTKRIEG